MKVPFAISQIETFSRQIGREETRGEVGMAKSSILWVVPALLALGGCVVGGEAARHDMEASKAALKACLTARGPEACEGQRQAYAADLAAYRATPKIVIGAGSPPPMPNMQPRLLIPATGGMAHMMVPMGGGNFMVMP